jgi:hypothetical protein
METKVQNNNSQLVNKVKSQGAQECHIQIGPMRWNRVYAGFSACLPYGLLPQ